MTVSVLAFVLQLSLAAASSEPEPTTTPLPMTAPKIQRKDPNLDKESEDYKKIAKSSEKWNNEMIAQAYNLGFKRYDDSLAKYNKQILKKKAEVKAEQGRNSGLRNDIKELESKLAQTMMERKRYLEMRVQEAKEAEEEAARVRAEEAAKEAVAARKRREEELERQALEAQEAANREKAKITDDAKAFIKEREAEIKATSKNMDSQAAALEANKKANADKLADEKEAHEQQLKKKEAVLNYKREVLDKLSKFISDGGNFKNFFTIPGENGAAATAGAAVSVFGEDLPPADEKGMPKYIGGKEDAESKYKWVNSDAAEYLSAWSAKDDAELSDLWDKCVSVYKSISPVEKQTALKKTLTRQLGTTKKYLQEVVIAATATMHAAPLSS